MKLSSQHVLDALIDVIVDAMLRELDSEIEFERDPIAWPPSGAKENRRDDEEADIALPAPHSTPIAKYAGGIVLIEQLCEAFAPNAVQK